MSSATPEGAGAATRGPEAPPPEFAAKQSSWRPFLLKLAASAGLMAYILSQADLGAVVAALAGVDPAWIAVAVVLQLIGPAIISLRWRGLLAARGVTPGWRYLYVSTLVSGFFRQFLPSTIGGDVIRGYDAWRAGASPGVALMSLVIDRMFGLLALVILVAGGVMLSDRLAERLPAIELWIALAFVILVAAMSQLLRPTRASLAVGRAGLGLAPAGLRGKLGQVAEALGSYRDAQGVLVASLVLSLALQVNVVTFYWALAQALGLAVDYASFYLIAPIAIFVMMLPISINGIGLREGILIFLLAQWGVGTAEAIALAWLEYGVFLAFGLIGGAIYALRGTGRPRAA